MLKLIIMICYDMEKLRTIARPIKHRRQTVQGQKQSVQYVFVRSNQQKAALEQQKAAMEHDLEVQSHPVFWFPYAIPTSMQVAWELVSELRGCLVDKMQQEDLQVPLSSHFWLKFWWVHRLWM